MSHEDEKDLELKVTNNANSGKVIYDFFKLKTQIIALGSENKLSYFPALCVSLIIAGVAFLGLIFSVYVYPIFWDDFGIRLGLIIATAIICAIFMGYSVHISNSDGYEEIRGNNAIKRDKIIDYILRYYLVYRKVLDAKKVKNCKDEGIEKAVENLTDERILNNNSDFDIEYLIEKFKKEMDALDEKIKRSVFLTFAVALATAGVNTVKELSSCFMWQYIQNEPSEATKSFVSMVGNFAAFLAFILLVFVIRSIRDTIDSSRSVKCQNLERAYYSLKRIKLSVEKTKSANLAAQNSNNSPAAKNSGSN